MKSFVVGLLLMTALACSSRAATYRGTITQAIAPFTDETGWYGQYQSGASYVGYYEYESATIDGTFYTSGFWSEYFSWLLGYTVNSSLGGTIFLPFPDNPGYSEARWNPFSDTRNGGTLTVSGGIVTGFEWSFEQGGLYSVFNTTGFFAIVYTDLYYFFPDLPPEEWMVLGIGGTVTFSAPSQVPDSSPTSRLFLLTSILIVAARCWVDTIRSGRAMA